MAAAGEAILRAVPAIKAIIEQGNVVDRRVGRRDHIVEQIVVAAPVRIGGRVEYMAVTINRTEDGRFHYSLQRDNGDRRVGSSLHLNDDPAKKCTGSGSLDATPDTTNLVIWRVRRKGAASR